MRDKTVSQVAGPERGLRAKASIMSLHAVASGAYEIPRLARIRIAATTIVQRIAGGTLLARFVAALHESRRREAQRVLHRYSHLIDKSEK